MTPRNPRKILAIKLRSLGDTVLITAPLAELRRAYPEAEIHVAVIGQWAPLLEGHPAADRVFTYERHKEPAARAKAATRLAFLLRKERYDCVVNFHASPSSAMISFATGAKVRSIHFHGHNDRNRYATVTVPGKGVLKPIIERDMDALRALGLHVPAGRSPEIHLQPTEIREAREFVSRLSLTQPVLGLGLGASRPTKSWPVERYAALAVQWCRELGGGALAVAGPGEDAQVRRFLHAVDDSLSMTIADAAERAAIRARISAQQSLPIRKLAALLGQLAVLVGNDSGPRHVALAVGAPTVTLFGPEHPFEWHPYPKETHPHFFIEELACRKDALPGMPAWCALEKCEAEQHRCMRLIGIEPVIAECKRVAREVAER